MCIRDSYSTYTWSYTDAGSYTITLTDSWGDGGQLVTAVGAEDQFQYDSEAWYDTDGDGLTDYIDPNSTVVAYTTVYLCSPAELTITSTATDSDGDTEEDEECTFTLPAGETLDLAVQTASWGSEVGIKLTDPSGTQVVWSHGSFASNGNYVLSGYTSTGGSYTLQIYDSYGDGCNPSSTRSCGVTASYTYISGTTVPTTTTYGTSVDNDDDGDGYSDLDEGDAYDTATAALCDDGSIYASSSDSLDASSTPADMDGDLTCDALDTCLLYTSDAADE